MNQYSVRSCVEGSYFPGCGKDRREAALLLGPIYAFFFFFVILEQSSPLGHRSLSLVKTWSFRLDFLTPARMPRDVHCIQQVIKGPFIIAENPLAM